MRDVLPLYIVPHKIDHDLLFLIHSQYTVCPDHLIYPASARKFVADLIRISSSYINCNLPISKAAAPFRFQLNLRWLICYYGLASRSLQFNFFDGPDGYPLQVPRSLFSDPQVIRSLFKFKGKDGQDGHFF